MNVGVCIRHEELEAHLQAASTNGFKEFQLVSWQPELWNDEEAQRIQALCGQYKMEMTAFWCGWEGPKVWDFYQGQETLGIVPVAYRYPRMKNLMDGADFAKKLGVVDVVTHMGFIPESPMDSNYPGVLTAVKAVGKHLNNQGQNLLFETGQETPVTLLRLFEDVGLANLYVNLDPANLIMYGKGNPVDSLEVFGKYIKGVHGKDGKYPTDGHHLGPEMKIGEGRVDFHGLIKGLHALGYTGSITIEREISGEQQLVDVVDAKAYLEAIIAGL